MKPIEPLQWDGPVLVVPGLRGSGPAHWQTHWERRYPQFVRVQQSDWNTPDLDRWARAIVEAAVDLDGPALVIAHSFGCLATVRAEVFQSNLIAGALLVAPANPAKFGLDDRLPHSPLLFPNTVVASHDDPWMPFETAQLWAGRWGSDFENVGWAGHINADSALGEWAAGQLLLRDLCRRASAAPPRFSGRPPAFGNGLSWAWA